MSDYNKLIAFFLKIRIDILLLLFGFLSNFQKFVNKKLSKFFYFMSINSYGLILNLLFNIFLLILIF